MYSGMHKAAGLNVQVACTPAGHAGGCPYVVCQAAVGQGEDGLAQGGLPWSRLRW